MRISAQSRRSRALGVLGCVVGLTAAAWGVQAASGSRSGAATISGTASEPSLTAAYNAAVKVPTSAGVVGRLSKKPPRGLRVVFLQCGAPICVPQGRYFTEAAKRLGWSVKRIVFQYSAGGLATAFDAAVQEKPTGGVVTSGFPRAVYEKQLRELNKRRIPVVDYATTNRTGGGLIAVIANDVVKKYGAYEALYIAHESRGSARVMMFNTPDFPVQVKLQQALEATLKKYCPRCTFDYQKVSLTDLGPNLPNIVVSALQRKPDTNYLVFGYADLTAGVPAALANAGLANKVKIVTAGPTQSTFQDIIDGRIAMAAAQPQEEQQWCLVEALARYHVGDNVPPNGCNLPSQILIKSNVRTAWKIWPGPPGWKNQFLKAWRVK